METVVAGAVFGFGSNHHGVIGRQMTGGRIETELVNGVQSNLPLRRQTGDPARSIGDVRQIGVPV
jgi:hypothetical protein